MLKNDRILFLVLMLCVAGFAHATQSSLQVGRYSTTAPIPLENQRDLFEVIIEVEFPVGVDTVGAALHYLLARSGYQLADLKASCPSMATLLSLPLPAVHRELGPMPLLDAIKTLAGPTHHLVFDPVHRLASFQLREQYRSLLAELLPLPGPQQFLSPIPPKQHPRDPQATATDSEKKHEQRPEQVSAGSINPQQYGPVRAMDKLWPIALGMRNDERISEECMVLGVFQRNPEAFCHDNMNCLKVGTMLKPPSPDMLTRICHDKAREEIKRQYRDWRTRDKSATPPSQDQRS